LGAPNRPGAGAVNAPAASTHLLLVELALLISSRPGPVLVRVWLLRNPVKVVVPLVCVVLNVPLPPTKLRVLAVVATPLPLPSERPMPVLMVLTVIGPAKVTVPVVVSKVALSPLSLFQTVV
jgi:hypothetical protein